MLSVNSVKFYQPNIKNWLLPPEQFTRLHFDKYPVTPEMFTLSVDFQAVGDVNGFHFVRVRVGNDVVYETGLSSLRMENAGSGKSFGMNMTLQEFTFPIPGLYWFDIVFNDSVIHSEPLTVT